MVPSSLVQLLRGPFNFLRRDEEEIRQLLPDAERILPLPQKIFLEDESSTPLTGFPFLLTEDLAALDQALETYLVQEEEVQIAILSHQTFDRALYANAWERYRNLLARATENVTTSSYGRHYPGIFWLYHSLAVARALKETPKRILRRDLTIGRVHGDEIKYRVFYKYLDRVLALTYDLVNRLALDTEEIEEELFPALMTRMRDNVLIFTEDHISPNLAELGSYFSGYLHIDGRDLRARLSALAAWNAEQLRLDADLRAAVALLGGIGESEPREHLNRTGYLTFLTTRPGYNRESLLPPQLVQVWESLLVKLKEFELFHALRRLLIPVERDGERLVSRDRSLNRFGITQPAVHLSGTTRPMDFMAPWVVDPQVSRFGMIYDITDFTETISVLRRSGARAQDRSFRMMFLYQRRVNRIAAQHRVKLEKYLGDGAFYSSREARQLLVVAILVQRSYRQALTEGFPFSHGLRIALNHGQYRLLPIQVGHPGEAERYEFFGHGVVELARLTTGKTTREIEEIKILLVSRGYPEQAVNRFFAPMTQQNLDIVDQQEEKRDFYAYINQNGTLINEGIVATGDFVAMLGQEGAFSRLFRMRDGERCYVVLQVPSPGGSLLVGVRKLGLAHLKGLDRVPVYEVLDAANFADTTIVELRENDLMGAIEREFTATLAGGTGAS